jgi:hypothetical protein
MARTLKLYLSLCPHQDLQKRKSETGALVTGFSTGESTPKILRLNRGSRQSIPRSTVQVPFEVESHHAVIHLRELEIFGLAGVGNVSNVGGSAVVPELMSWDPRRERFDVGLHFG